MSLLCSNTDPPLVGCADESARPRSATEVSQPAKQESQASAANPPKTNRRCKLHGPIADTTEVIAMPTEVDRRRRRQRQSAIVRALPTYCSGSPKQPVARIEECAPSRSCSVDKSVASESVAKHTTPYSSWASIPLQSPSPCRSPCHVSWQRSDEASSIDGRGHGVVFHLRLAMHIPRLVRRVLPEGGARRRLRLFNKGSRPPTPSELGGVDRLS